MNGLIYLCILFVISKPIFVFLESPLVIAVYVILPFGDTLKYILTDVPSYLCVKTNSSLLDISLNLFNLFISYCIFFFVYFFNVPHIIGC